MYITCEQCNTIFRLDENRLKTTGSKVRCCQCRNVFVAWPPAPSGTGPADTKDMEDATAQYAVPSSAQHAEDTFDQELEGIDLAELDSILDQDQSEDFSTTDDGRRGRVMAETTEKPGELDESDLDMDFESELALDDEHPEDSNLDAGGQPEEDLDLEMDFELESTALDNMAEASADDQLAAGDLEMDFELDQDQDQQVDAHVEDVRSDAPDGELGEDIESALDDFEDVLSEAEPDETSPGSMESEAVQIEEEIDLSDLEGVLETTDETEPASDTADLGDIEAVLDVPDAEGDMEGEGDFDIDLSDLDMDLDMDLDDVDSSEVMDEGDQAESTLAEEDAAPLEETPEPEPEDVSAAADAEQDDEFDLSDLEGLMDLDEGQEAAEAVATQGDGDTGFSLDEDLTLAEETAPSGAAAALDQEPAFGEPEDEDVFDLSDLDGLMDLDTEDEEDAAEASTQEDGEAAPSLDEDLTLDEGAAISDVAAALDEELASDQPEGDEVFDLSDLDGIMDLDEEEGEAAEETIEANDEVGLSLDTAEESPLETEKAGDVASGAISEDQADDLDLSDLGGLDTMLDEDQLDDDSEQEEMELSLDDDTESEPVEDQELTLEMDTEPAVASDIEAKGQDLDLEGLGGLLDEEEETADESGPEDLELSLDDEFEAGEPGELSPKTPAEEEIGEAEDLEFSLDSEFEDEQISLSDEEDIEASDEDEELDLTDLEKMLENETLVPEPGPQVLDSGMSLVGGDESADDREADSLGLDSGAELDLSEIEAAIDSAEEDADLGGEEDVELELDLESVGEEGQMPLVEGPGDDLELELEMERDSAATQGGAADDDQDAIDLSDLDLSLEEKPDAEGEVVNAGEMELEFQIEDEMEPETIDSAETMSGDVSTASYSKTTVPADDDAALIGEAFTEPSEIEEEDAKPAADKKKKQKKGSSLPLIIILILVLLAAAGFFGYQYAVKNNIAIPLLNDLINPQPQDPNGIAMLTTMDINSKFIENEKGGRIFVVSGKVRNGYPVPCNKIQLRGKLFTKGKVLSKTEVAYAGVVINDLELASQEVAQIKQRLKTGGGQAAELVVNSGQSLPFMVVFSDLPADLDEFAIELVGSTKVQ